MQGYPSPVQLKIDTIMDILRWRALHQPDSKAFTFLADGEKEERCVTYSELASQAQAIAAMVQHGTMKNKRALLLYSPGLDFIAAFFGCLYAGVTPVPAYPLRGSRNISWLHAVAADAEVSVALTTKPLLPTLKRQLGLAPNLRWLTTDDLINDRLSGGEEMRSAVDRMAYLQYTSGSTMAPRGVMISHRNLMHNLALIKEAFQHDESTVVVSWLPPYHDMGLIGGILQPLYCGFHCVLMSPAAFIQRPSRWLQAITRYRATTSGGPNFAYDTCVRQITNEERATLDLSSWSIAFNGSEPVRANTLERFTEAFSYCGFKEGSFFPCYGLAEATLFVTGVRRHTPKILRRVASPSSARLTERTALVSCGRLPHEQEVVIVEPDLQRRCASGEIGEIWISGPCVAQGYWKKPEESKDTFQASLPDAAGRPFLRTGDLGLIDDSELFIVGRMKDLIIIRGVNYYSSDIEHTVENSHSALAPCGGAAFSVEGDGSERIVVLQEIARQRLRNFDANEIIESIRQAIAAAYQQQVYAVVLLKPAALIRTPNGKVRRQACRASFLENRFHPLASWRMGDAPEAGLGGANGERDTEASANNHKFHALSATKSQETGLDDDHAESWQASGKSRRRRIELVEWLRSYADERINSQIISERRCIPPYIVLDMGNRGILGMQVPEKYGGIELRYTDAMLVLEQLAAIDLTLASFVGVQNALGIPPIMKYAAPGLRDDVLPLIASGRELAAFALSEPSAGSNPMALATVAVPEGDGWRLRGEKIWIGSGSWAGVISVFVQLLDADQRMRGITGFALRQGTPGLKQGAEALTLGMRGMVQTRIRLNDVYVGREDLLGEPGVGMEIAQDAMRLGRLGIAAMGIGGMKRCAQLMLRYTERRRISTGRLLDNPLTLARLDELTASVRALEALVSSVAAQLDEGAPVPHEAFAACKIAGPEFLWNAADSLVQLLGGRGYTENNVAPQILSDARLLRIFEGPTETMKTYLGEGALYRGEALHRFLRDVLKAPAVADKLKIFAEKIHERWLRRRGNSHVNAAIISWTSAMSGEVAMWALLEAALQHETSRAPASRLDYTIEWTRQHFKRAARQALARDAIPPTDARAMAAEIHGYFETIGDVEQGMASVEHELDTLLRRKIVDAAQDAEPGPAHNLPRQLVEAKAWPENRPRAGDQPYSAETIEQWTMSWLSQHLKISPPSLSPEVSFMSYGLDSMSASKLVSDMEDWLGRSLPLNLAFEHPTPRALANHLALEAAEGNGLGRLLESLSGEAAPPGADDPDWEVTRL